jgi:hypothetical protein
MEGTMCTFSVTQTGGIATATVVFSTANGSAVGGFSCAQGVDFIAINGGQVAVGPNSSAPISVQTCSDFAFDPNQTFSVSLISVSSGTIADGSGQGTIMGS